MIAVGVPEEAAIAAVLHKTPEPAGAIAERAGIDVGDVVRTVNGLPVQAPADIKDALAGGAAVQIEASDFGDYVVDGHVIVERKPLPGRVPHFELVFFLTMEAFGKIHPSQRHYAQWDSNPSRRHTCLDIEVHSA